MLSVVFKKLPLMIQFGRWGVEGFLWKFLPISVCLDIQAYFRDAYT